MATVLLKIDASDTAGAVFQRVAEKLALVEKAAAATQNTMGILEKALASAGSAASGAIAGMDMLTASIKALGTAAAGAEKKLGRFSTALGVAETAVGGFATRVDTAAVSISTTTNALSAYIVKLADVKIAQDNVRMGNLLPAVPSGGGGGGSGGGGSSTGSKLTAAGELGGVPKAGALGRLLGPAAIGVGIGGWAAYKASKAGMDYQSALVHTAAQTGSTPAEIKNIISSLDTGIQKYEQGPNNFFNPTTIASSAAIGISGGLSPKDFTANISGLSTLSAQNQAPDLKDADRAVNALHNAFPHMSIPQVIDFISQAEKKVALAPGVFTGIIPKVSSTALATGSSMADATGLFEEGTRLDPSGKLVATSMGRALTDVTLKPSKAATKILTDLHMPVGPGAIAAAGGDTAWLTMFRDRTAAGGADNQAKLLSTVFGQTNAAKFATLLMQGHNLEDAAALGQSSGASDGATALSGSVLAKSESMQMTEALNKMDMAFVNLGNKLNTTIVPQLIGAATAFADGLNGLITKGPAQYVGDAFATLRDKIQHPTESWDDARAHALHPEKPKVYTSGTKNGEEAAHNKQLSQTEIDALIKKAFHGPTGVFGGDNFFNQAKDSVNGFLGGTKNNIGAGTGYLGNILPGFNTLGSTLHNAGDAIGSKIASFFDWASKAASHDGGASTTPAGVEKLPKSSSFYGPLLPPTTPTPSVTSQGGVMGSAFILHGIASLTASFNATSEDLRKKWAAQALIDANGGDKTSALSEAQLTALNTANVRPFHENNPGLGGLQAAYGSTAVRYGGGADPRDAEIAQLKQQITNQAAQIALLQQIATNTKNHKTTARQNPLTVAGSNYGTLGR